MDRYVFYNSTTGDIEFIKKFTDEQAQQNLDSNKNLSCVRESVVGYVLNKDIKKIDVDTVTLIDKARPTREIWGEVRQMRNMKMVACDWCVGVDSPFNDAKKAEWVTYRQALRDVPANNTGVTKIKDIVWPAEPS